METLRKIDELINQNKILEQRNEELKNILEVNLTQSHQERDHTFSSNIDFSDAKTLIVKFYQFNKIPITLFDDKGKLIFSLGGKNNFVLYQPNYDHLFQEYLDFKNLQSQSQSDKPESLFELSNGALAFALSIEVGRRTVAVIIVSHFYNSDNMPSVAFIESLAHDHNLDFYETITASKEIKALSAKEIENTIQNVSMLGELVASLGKKNMDYQQQLKRQADNDIVMSALHDKISEQERIIKSLLANINAHQHEVRENTISKSAFQLQQKRLVGRIKHSEALLNSLLTSIPLGVGFVKSNIFTFTNDQMFRITGYTPKELIGRNPDMLFASQDDYNEIMQGKPVSFLFKDNNSYEKPIVRKDGNILDTVIFVSLIDPELPDDGVAISIMDISDIKKVQYELIQEKERAEESDRLKSAFLDNMSHEFRTPMNAIIGFTELLVSPYLTEKQRTEYYKIVQNNGRKLLRLIDDIIDISKLSSNQLQLHQKNFSLHKIMTDLYDTFAELVVKKHDNEVKILLIEPEECSCDLLFNDDQRIKQVLSNLLSNSLKYTSKGTIEFGYQIVSDNIQFFVKDTGIGIRKKQVESVFERFIQGDELLTRKHGGAGLGLSLAKGLVKLMGGQIWVESRWRKGSSFFFTIPLVVPADIGEIHINARTLRSNDWSNKTILIAEDEELNYMYLQTLLIPTKANVKWVENGQKAIDYVNEYPDVNLILMDIRMPVLNGIEATKAIKSSNQNIPIIAQTAYAQPSEKDNYIGVGCDDFIPKPIDSKHFMSVLERFLNAN